MVPTAEMSTANGDMPSSSAVAVSASEQRAEDDTQAEEVVAGSSDPASPIYRLDDERRDDAGGAAAAAPSRRAAAARWSLVGLFALGTIILTLRSSGGTSNDGPSRRTTRGGGALLDRLLARHTHAKPLSDPISLTPQDARKLLDFAIVGFPKTGTSFMEHYLFNQQNTAETHLDNREHCLGKEDNFDALENLVNQYGFEIDGQTSEGVKVKNAIKCPHELYGPYNLANYERYLPEIKFIVSLRHPVWWFQSYYNFKLRQRNKQSGGAEIWAPPTRELIGPCAEGPYHYGGRNRMEYHDKHNVCSDGAKFHHALSRFGKTPMSDEREIELLGHHEMSVHSFPRAKVFLMELGQFGVDDRELADKFLLDMKDYLGLEADLPPLYKHVSKPQREEVADYYINICDDEHSLVRAELVETGRDAYVWIRDYFLKSPDVVVSSPTHFLELLERWQFDPCIGSEELI